MSNTIDRVRAFCDGRDNVLQGSRPEQAKTYLAISNECTDLKLSSENPGPDLLDWLSKPHSDPDLRRACVTVFEILGSG